MFTPQQLEEVAFARARFNGYDIDSVDEVLQPLIADYCTLYKENGLLKSKMRVLVEKLEEYRSGEAELRETMVRTQRQCDQMILEAEGKCAQMLSDASAAVAETQKAAGAKIAAENARVEEAKQVTDHQIGEILSQLSVCAQMLQRIRQTHQPADGFRGYSPADAVADEISSTLEAMMGTAEESAPKAPPRHPQEENTGDILDLEFGAGPHTK